MPAPEDTVAALAVELPVDRASVEAARLALWRWWGDEALSARVRTSIELVLEEVVMNIVLHAHDEPAGRHVALQFSRSGDALQLQIEDTGRPFDPTAERATPPDPDQPGGLGLPLLRKRTRWMRYERVDGRNCLTLAVPLA